MYRPVQRRIVIFLLKLWGPHIRDPSSCLHFLYYRHEGSYKGLLISEVVIRISVVSCAVFTWEQNPMPQ